MDRIENVVWTGSGGFRNETERNGTERGKWNAEKSERSLERAVVLSVSATEGEQKREFSKTL